MMVYRSLWKEHLRWAEDFREHPYRCSAGKLTIGYGRNLEDKGISKPEAEHLLDNDMSEVLKDAVTLPYWDRLTPVRQLIVADMIFNLGFGGFKKFRRMNRALAAGDYQLAAHEMTDSDWFGQVGRRAERLHSAMITGHWHG